MRDKIDEQTTQGHRLSSEQVKKLGLDGDHYLIIPARPDERDTPYIINGDGKVVKLIPLSEAFAL